MMKLLRALPAAVLVLAGLVSRLGAADAAFDTFADAVAAEWMRANPTLSTTQQYFTGAEQDALDRQLTPITKEARAARVGIAKRGLSSLAQFDRARHEVFAEGVSQRDPPQRQRAARRAGKHHRRLGEAQPIARSAPWSCGAPMKYPG